MPKAWIWISLALVLVFAAGCDSGNGSTSSVATSPTSSSQPQVFQAIPDFSNFGDCGHPCDLGVYPTPTPAPGTPSITQRYPLEASANSKGDQVLVKCQVSVPEKPVRNQIGATSIVWDGIIIPQDKLTDAARAQLFSGQQEVIGYAPDMWLGNTGLHAPKCSII